MTTSNEVPQILIVDDKPANLLVLEKTLSKLNVAICQAASGHEALLLTLEHDFALGIIDIQMPEMNGYELVELLRGNPKTKSLPVIFVSAIYADTYHHVKGYESGAVDFLSKPFEPEILLSKVRVFLRLYEQRRELEHVVGRLQEQTQTLFQTNNALGRRNAQLAVAHTISQQITSILELEALLTAVVQLIRREFNYDYVSIWLTSPEQNHVTLQTVASRQDNDTLFTNHQIRYEATNSAIAQVCQTRQPVIITNLAQDVYQAALRFRGTAQSELVVPLLAAGELLGVLDVLSDQPAAFNHNDLGLFNIWASQIAIAIRNAHLYATVRRFNEELEENVRARTAELQTAYQELALLDHNKSEFIQVVSHELRTPLTVVKAYSQLMLGETLPETHRQYLEGILTGAVRMNELVNNMIDMIKIDTNVLSVVFEEVYLADLLEGLQEQLTPHLEERHITLTMGHFADLPSLQGDQVLLHKVFHHLLINAIKYTPDNGRITVNGRLQTYPDGQFIEITIEDTGIGIAPEHQKAIFLKFYQTGRVALHSSGTTKFKGGGPGLGLAIVDGIVRAHGGTIWVESPGHNEETCPGSTFYIILPLQPKQNMSHPEIDEG